jgi:hypothetical protein
MTELHEKCTCQKGYDQYRTSERPPIEIARAVPVKEMRLCGFASPRVIWGAISKSSGMELGLRSVLKVICSMLGPLKVASVPDSLTESLDFPCRRSGWRLPHDPD